MKILLKLSVCMSLHGKLFILCEKVEKPCEKVVAFSHGFHYNEDNF